MTAKLEFNLPEDAHDFNIATNGWKWLAVVSDLDNSLRDRIKYGINNGENLDVSTLEKVRSEIWELLKEYNLSFDS
jgi:hypothetical protein